MTKRKFKIVLTGPESTGKTTLSELLAAHFDQTLCSEYAREYTTNIQRPITLEDIRLMHDIQMNKEASSWKLTSKILFCDTDVLNFKIWIEHVFQQTPDWILKSLSENKYDFYLLCFPDIDWVPDGIRVNQLDRMIIYKKFLEELENANANYFIVRGKEEQRFTNCVTAIDNFLLLNS